VEASIKVWCSFTGHSAGAGNENVFQITLPLVTASGDGTITACEGAILRSIVTITFRLSLCC
jgi:hypothetical protein